MEDSDFTREEFYGICFPWFAVDREGRIGLLTAGYSPVPRIIFDGGEEVYEQVRDTLLDLPETSGALLSDRCRNILETQPGVDFTENEKESRKGFFSFEETGQGGPYILYCTPINPLHVGDLPPEIRKELRKLTMDAVLFREDEEIDVAALFDC